MMMGSLRQLVFLLGMAGGIASTLCADNDNAKFTVGAGIETTCAGVALGVVKCDDAINGSEMQVRDICRKSCDNCVKPKESLYSAPAKSTEIGKFSIEFGQGCSGNTQCQSGTCGTSCSGTDWHPAHSTVSAL